VIASATSVALLAITAFMKLRRWMQTKEGD